MKSRGRGSRAPPPRPFQSASIFSYFFKFFYWFLLFPIEFVFYFGLRFYFFKFLLIILNSCYFFLRSHYFSLIFLFFPILLFYLSFCFGLEKTNSQDISRNQFLFASIFFNRLLARKVSHSMRNRGGRGSRPGPPPPRPVRPAFYYFLLFCNISIAIGFCFFPLFSILMCISQFFFVSIFFLGF